MPLDSLPPHTADEPPPASAEPLLRDLCAAGGLDFASYRPASLVRRILRRMAQLGLTEFAAYRAHLAAHPEEHRQLDREVPVHRTEFFRDPESWAYLAARVVPGLAESGRPLRAWSAGCATGEEAYTLAIVLAEAAGAADADRVRVYATDVSAAAVAAARTGRYTADDVRPIPPDLLARYLRPQGAGYVVSPELRRCVVFARHDLLTDPPLGRLRLVACRNTLMYFTPAAQVRTLARLYLALAPGGVLFTGLAEHPQAWGNFFATDSIGHRVYRRAGRAFEADALRTLARGRRRGPAPGRDRPAAA